MTVSAKEAQDRLPDLLSQAAQGEEVKITSGDGNITYRLVMVARKTAERVADSGDGSESLPPLAEMVGKGKGLYQSPKEVDQHIRNLRDEWDS